MSGARHARGQVCQEPGMSGISGIPDMSGTRCVRSGQVCQGSGMPGTRYSRHIRCQVFQGCIRTRYVRGQVYIHTVPGTIANSNSLKLKSCGSCGIVS